MATEGTYPFDGGGVGTWCHQLCEGLSDIDFTLLAVTGDTRENWVFERSPSVKRVVHVPMWPGEEPAIYLQPGRYSDVMQRRWRTTSRAITTELVPHLRVVLREILVGGVPIRELVTAITSVGQFLRKYDYKTSMRHSGTWRAFLDAVEAFSQSDMGRGLPPPTLADVTMCARWFYHMMMPLAVTVKDATVFHATSTSSCALPGIVARRLDGTRFILTEHGVYLRERYIAMSASEYSQVQKRFHIGLATMIGRACYATADVVAPVAACNSRWEIPWGAPPERIRVIYNGVDTNRFRPGPKPEKRQGRPTVVAAARVFPLKDIETMIRATDVARKKIPDLHVIVYGSLKADVPYVEKCERLIAELDVGKSFEFGGFHSTPWQIFLEGDISCLSSISEGFPYTVIESMACAVPCVATDVGGVREAVANTGLIVPPRNPQALGEAMVELLQQPERRRDLARRARERVVSEFTIQKQLWNYDDLYHEMHASA